MISTCFGIIRGWTILTLRLFGLGPAAARRSHLRLDACPISFSSLVMVRPDGFDPSSPCYEQGALATKLRAVARVRSISLKYNGFIWYFPQLKNKVS